VAIDREELLGIAHAERQRLGRMIQFAEPDSWEQPSADPGWWNRDVMAHLMAGDTAAAQLMAREPAEELEEYRAQLGEEPFTVDGWNAWTVNRRSGLETRMILDTWGAAAESFLVYAGKLDDDDWRNARFPWIAGDIAARYSCSRAWSSGSCTAKTCARRTGWGAAGRPGGSIGRSI
jgi:Mycothiol maleylpyruvate isomerase N-terminal domain.